jgi:hypothetical protein
MSAPPFTVEFHTKSYTILVRGEEGTATLDVYRDLYKAGRTAWLASTELQQFMFPLRMVGADCLTEDGYSLEVSFFLDDRWAIEVEHTLGITVLGSLLHDKGRDPFANMPNVSHVGILKWQG